MRIGIDISVLQGGSAQRGMGHYTVQQLMAVINDDHEFILFHQPFNPKPVLPQSLTKRQNVELVSLDFPQAVSLQGGKFTREGEAAYTEAMQQFIAPYQLDLFHLTCFDDNAFYFTPREWHICPLVMTVYDLIPLQMADIFLVDSQQRASYMDALDLMKNASALIAISEDACQEVNQRLNITKERIFIAPPYATAKFHPIGQDSVAPTIVRQIGARYIYTISSLGDHKNLKRLLQAFALLPVDTQNAVKLVISAGVEQHHLPEDFAQLIKKLGIGNRLVWTPRLSDNDVVALYQHAEICSHVSLIEGFGLPILEAMQCGIPVLTSNRGAMREVAGAAARLVDPEDANDISTGLNELLTTLSLRKNLHTAGIEQAKNFNEARLADNTQKAYASITPRRLRIAMWSPLPPARSGISDYTAELVPYLAQHVDLVLYTNHGVSRNLFRGLPVVLRTYDEYESYQSEPIDIHIYHMGNNFQFHEEIYFQLLRQPGIVVLHDLSIFNFFYSLDEKHTDISLKAEVAYSEGENIAEHLTETIQKWVASMDNTDYLQIPMLRRIIDNATAIISHSEFGRNFVQRYGQAIVSEFIHLGTEIISITADDTSIRNLRQKHQWTDSHVVFGIFGGINPIKRIHVVLEAFGSLRKTTPNARLIIVGREDDSQYIERLHNIIQKHNLSDVVTFVGEVPLNTLNEYISAIDVSINLRWPTAGETSAVMMRVLGAGKPVIMSDMAQWSHFPNTFCRRIPVGQTEIRTLAHEIHELSQNRAILRDMGEKAREYIQSEASFEIISRKYFEMAQRIKTTDSKPTKISFTGLNFIGDLHGDYGLSEACRGIVTAVNTTSVPLAYEEFAYNPHSRNTKFDEPPHGMPYNVSLFQLNAPEMSEAIEKLGVQILHGRYNIGYWFYELPDLPETWIPVTKELDEIWVATEFVKEAVERSTNIPVTVVPIPLTVAHDPSITRARFGIPESRFIFLYSFSTWSSSARKNPFGLLAAFREAVRLTDKPLTLVMKVHFLDHYPDLKAEIMRRAEGLPIIFLEENLSRIEMNSLINLCDCYISLHRSEAIGLGMAEAMALGKPVIGTGWSGNLDFMTPDNSYLVNVDVGPIRDSHHEFQETHKWLYIPNASIWADPNVNHAAQLMRDVVENPSEAAEKGRRAAETIREYFNPSIIGERIESHLQTIDVTRGKYYNPLLKSAVSSYDVQAKSLGINIIGDLMSDNGLGEVARSMVKMLTKNQIPVAYDEFIIDPIGRTTRIDSIQRGRVNEINLLHINAPFLNNLMKKDFASRLQGKFNVGYWFYELPDFPVDWSTAGDYLDEIWVSTRFVQDAIQKSTKTPVHVIPTPIHVDTNITPNRSRFNIPENQFAFLFSFNPGSSAGRKNPFGLLDAYEKAFGTSGDRPLLVLKIQFMDKFPEFAAEMRRRVNDLGVHLIEENLSRDEMYSLIASCDCYISLHRSEGWGLGLAEAMAMGKPVIGTGWSGNVDFMNHENSYLVDYEVVPVKAEHHAFQESYIYVFRPGTSHWADPNLDHAAQLMRHVVENPEDAAEKGRRASQSIRENFNDMVLGQRIRNHLATIDITQGKYYAPSVITSTKHHIAVDTGVSSISTINSGVGMYHLQRAFSDWNRERLRTTIWGFGTFINRIPVLGFIFRTLVRIRNLGKVWAAETVLLEALVREIENGQIQRSENSRLINDLYNEVTATKTSQNHQIAETNNDITNLKNTQATLVDGKLVTINKSITLVDGKLGAIDRLVTQSTQEIGLLRQGHEYLQTVQIETDVKIAETAAFISKLREALKQLESQQNDLDDRTRHNTSQLRLILLELADSLSEASLPSIIEIVRWLETKSPELAVADRIDFTLHGQIDDPQTISLGNHWRGRLSNITPTVWYHFDKTDHWQSPVFFDNIRAKLAESGLLVIAVWSDKVIWPESDGFELISHHNLRSGKQVAQMALYRKVVSVNS